MNKYDAELLQKIHNPGSGKPPPLYPKPNFKVEDYPVPVAEIKVPEDTSMYKHFVSVYDRRYHRKYALDVNTITKIVDSRQHNSYVNVTYGADSQWITISFYEYFSIIEPALNASCKKLERGTGRVIHIDD